MNKLNLHRIRKEIDDLFYITFDSLTFEQRESFKKTLESIDTQIKQLEDF